MNIEFLKPFIALLVIFSWSSCAKIQCKAKHAFVYYYFTPLYDYFQLGVVLCIIAGLIITLINAGFLIFLAYLGVTVITILLAQLITSHILIWLFGYEDLGVILPWLCAFVSAIWMFCKAGSFN